MKSASAASPSQAAAALAGAAISGIERPTFKDKTPPRYRLLEKAFLSGIKLRRGNDWVPYDDVLLDPESQPLVNKLSGPFSGTGDVERMPIEIEFPGIPDEHLEPINESAEWMMEHVDELKDAVRREEAKGAKGRRRRLNPIDQLTIVGPDATVLREASQQT